MPKAAPKQPAHKVANQPAPKSAPTAAKHDPPLYLAGGFATAKAFLTTHLGETERTAYRNVRVAKYASPAEEARYDVAKLDLVLSYVEAKLGAPARCRRWSRR